MARARRHGVPAGTVIETDGEGWWATLPCGWCLCGEPGDHTAHEDTKAAVIDQCRDAVRCDCAGCSTEGK